MDFSLKDGTGTDSGAKIDAEHRLHTFSVVETEDRHVNKEGRTWSYYFTVTPAGNDDVFFYLENNQDVALTITDIRIMCGAAETIRVEGVSGTPSYAGGTTIAPVNRNRGKTANEPTAVVKSDTNTTGLSEDGTIFFIRCDTANKMEHLRTSSNIIIPKGTAVALICATGSSLVTAVVSVSVIDEQSL
jgi:hypothetical protein